MQMHLRIRESDITNHVIIDSEMKTVCLYGEWGSQMEETDVGDD